MLKVIRNHGKKLIPSRQVFITLVFILFSIGSYTYSEITPLSISAVKNTNTQTNYLKNFTRFSAYYHVPATKQLVSKPRIKEIAAPPSESIMDTGSINASALAGFLALHNKDIDSVYAHKLANLYITEAVYEGVNPDLAFTQMCLETGFLKYNGTVDKEQNNFCGLGATGNGVKGLSFTNPKDGVRAHIQHLKAYGSTKDLNNVLIDSRFKYVKRGSVTNLSGLTGKWATDKKYDKKIRSLLKRLYTYSQSEEIAGS